MYTLFVKTGDKITIVLKSASLAAVKEHASTMYGVDVSDDPFQTFEMGLSEILVIAPFEQKIEGASSLPLLWKELRLEGGKLVEHLLYGGQDLPIFDQIEAEEERRITAFASVQKQTLTQQRMIELLEQGKVNWSDDEKAEVGRIRAGNAYIKTIRDASDALKAMKTLPDDWKSDEHWPVLDLGE